MDTKIQARIDPELKAQGEHILSELGMTTTELMRMTFRQLVMRKGLPFDARIPNADTIEALNEDLSNAKRFNTVDELMADLEADNGD